MLTFDGDVVIVTGGGGGIGAALCRELGRRGARVVVNDLGGTSRGEGASLGIAEAVAAEIRNAGGEAIADGNSTVTPEGALEIVASALRTWGRVDGLVANAAIMRNAHFEDMSIEDWDSVLTVNLRGMFCVAQAVYRQMKEQRSGRILLPTSSSGVCGSFGQVNYATAKAGNIGLMRSIAFEGARFGIKTNGYMPVSTTSRLAESMDENDSMYVGRPENLQFDPSDPSLALLSPERLHPMLIALLHKSCPANGHIFGAAGGYFNRYWMTSGEGWVGGLDATAEDVASHWDEIANEGEGGEEVIGDSLSFALPLLSRKLAPFVGHG